MTTVTVTSRIAAPIDEVFELFTDVQHAPAHVSGIEKIEMLTPGRLRLGTRWRETRHVLGRDDSAEMEVTSYERNRTYTITHHKSGVRIDTLFWFEPDGDNTKVTVEFELDTAWMPPAVLTPLGRAVANRVREVLDHDLADLRSSIERAKAR